MTETYNRKFALKRIQPNSNGKIYRRVLIIYFDIDCFYLFIISKENFVIFRGRETIVFTFEKMKISHKRSKTNIFIKDKTRAVQPSDYLLLEFASCRLSFESFFLYFVAEDEFDNVSKHRRTLKRIN